VEWIVGVRRGYDGLVIDPCLPPDWPEVQVQRTFRGATYAISIRNPDGLTTGRPLITVDGEELQANILPVFGDGKTHDVVVTMGEIE
jgi:cellobiose phosphorylase